AQLYPERTFADLAALSLGERDRLLLEARRAIFGTRLACFTRCPQCAEALEFDLDSAALCVSNEVAPARQYETIVDGVKLCFRLIDSRDLLAAASCRDAAEARACLLDRIVTACDGDGAPVHELPAGVEASVGARLASLDPQADVTFSLCCAACSHAWTAFLDIGAFFWSELTTKARRLLLEVHVLARAYGWSESTILSLGRRRREAYLSLVTA